MLKANFQFECEAGDVQNFCTTVQNVLARIVASNEQTQKIELARAQGENREKVIHGIGDVIRPLIPAINNIVASKFGMKVTDEDLNKLIVKKITSVVPDIVEDFLHGLKEEVEKHRATTPTSTAAQTESVTETVEDK